MRPRFPSARQASKRRCVALFGHTLEARHEVAKSKSQAQEVRAEVAALDELASELGVTRERIRQIQVEALEKLRGRIACKGFEKDDLL